MIRHELKRLIPVAIPAVLSQLAQMAMGVIDTLMAGRYSTEALAAIAVGTNILHPVFVFFLGLFLALNPIVAHFRGENASKKVGVQFRLGILVALLVTPIAMSALLASNSVLNALGINPQIAALAYGYLQATAIGMLPLMLFLALRFFNEGLFATPAIMWATTLSIPANIFLNYAFLYGYGPIPEMGAVGVGYATSLVWLLMFIGLLVYTLTNRAYREFELLNWRHWPRMTHVKELFRLGLPMAITLGFEITMFAAIALMIARYPVEIVAAHQIAINIASVTFMIPLGISQAITARVGYFMGKQDPQQAKLAGYTGIGLAALVMLASAIMMMTLPYSLVSLYTHDTKLMETAVGLLYLAAIFQFSDGLQVSSAGALRGLKDTKIPMYITAFAYWLIGFPCGYFLAEQAGFAVKGYWMGLIAGLSSAALLLLARWVWFVRRKLGQSQAQIV